jgi:hypothetical protein
MKKKRFDRLTASVKEVQAHVATGRFAGRLTKIKVGSSPPRQRPARPNHRARAEGA